MRVMICGIDGYLGWPLALHLASRGHEISGIDNQSRRRWVNEVGSQSILPVMSVSNRAQMFNWFPKNPIDLTNYTAVLNEYQQFQPDCIVYLGEQPSAPFSMRSVEHACSTQYNNVIGTLVTLWAIKSACPKAHLLKLGSMGEYGTPNKPIPESGPHEFPRQPGSYYHASKVHDSVNIEFACRAWGLRSTDVMQGVVYGTRIDEITSPDLCTRFDVDQDFGTVINRFCAQAVIDMPLTIYGTGGQQRGFLPLRDSIQCLTLAVENPPSEGEYRVFNQMESHYSIRDLALTVQKVAQEKFGLNVQLTHNPNPRTESENHFYKPVHDKLLHLGYEPTTDMDAEIATILEDILPYKECIEQCRKVLPPSIRWKN